MELEDVSYCSFGVLKNNLSHEIVSKSNHSERDEVFAIPRLVE